MPLLEVKDLNVSVEGKEILKNFNLKLEKGKVYALMGPNGSGKSTLAHVLMGNKKFDSSGNIFLEGKEISSLNSNERAKKGIFLSFQYPVEISGVTISNFLRTAYNALNEKKAGLLDFQKLLKKNAKKLNLDEKFFSRFLNEGFSGGEKKKAETLQLLTLNPRFAILDETDSGLDIDSLRVVSEGIKNFMNKDKTILIITHYKRILDYVKPDVIFIMKGGKIVKQGSWEMIDEIEKKGYENMN